MLIYYISIVVFLFDQLTKLLITNIFEQGRSVAVIQNIFHLTLVNNTGVAFGVLKNQRFFILGVSLITILILLIFKDSITEKKRSNEIFLGFILGGALGNFIDRCRFASVVDFLDFRIWPVFNVADSFICIGVFLLILCTLFCFKKDQ